MEIISKADAGSISRFCESSENSIVLLYGHKNIEFGGMIEQFKDADGSFYYFASSASPRQQLSMLAERIRSHGFFIDPNHEQEPEVVINSLFAMLTDKTGAVIIDNIEFFVRMIPGFIRYIKVASDKYWQDKSGRLVILISHDTDWVENNMIADIGDEVVAINGFLKARGGTFSDLRDYYSNLSFDDQVYIYSCLGSMSGLWRYFDQFSSFKENVCKNLLDPGAYLYGEANRMIEHNLRETSVYNTILTQMARGNHKLNDLHHATGFSRAKISVYIKNLIHHEYVYKAYSFESAGRDNVQKGVYKIADPLIDFYFTFIYPNESSLRQMSAEEFYDIFISAGLRKYSSEKFKDVCREYITKENLKSKLPVKIGEMGEWIGKLGNLDIVIQNDTGDTILGQSVFGRMAKLSDLSFVYECAKMAKLEGDFIYLFSDKGFEEELIDVAAESDAKIRLIGTDEIINE